LEEAYQNSETLLEFRATFPTFPTFSGATASAMQAINQRREVEDQPDLSFFIWRADEKKWKAFAHGKATHLDVVRLLKGVSVREQWRFNPSSNQFVKIPLSYSGHMDIAPTGFEAMHVPTVVPVVSFVEDMDLSPDTLSMLNKLADHKGFRPYVSCPLTGKPFQNPVITPFGQTYDRYLLDKHVLKHGNDPLTKKPLSPQGYVSNKSLMDVLVHFRDIIRGNQKWLLCPILGLPIRNPRLVNMLSLRGRMLCESQGARFLPGVSYDMQAFSELLEEHEIDDEDLIPNLALEKLIIALERMREEWLDKQG
jgi:hypothetical protein